MSCTISLFFQYAPWTSSSYLHVSLALPSTAISGHSTTYLLVHRFLRSALLPYASNLLLLVFSH